MDGAQATTMRVDYDVLLNILDHSKDQPDFCRLMRTCWTLYEAGVPRLLRRLGGRISVYTCNSLITLCAFMIRKNPNRFQHLIELDINLERPFYKDARANKAIAFMFKRTSQLATLKLSRPEYLLADKVVLHAIASLSSLREVVLRGIADEVVLLLETIKSPIRKVSIDFDHEWAEDGGDPLPLLKNLADSLEELAAYWVNLETPGVQYPHLTALDLDTCLGFDFETLYSAFPNLRYLSLHTGTEDDWIDDVGSVLQRQHNLTAQADLGTWQSLSYIESGISTVYLLALQCSVEHLDMRSSRLTRESCDFLRVVLSEVLPSAVSLSFSTKEFDTSFLGMTLMPSIRTLHELSLHINFYGGEYVDPSPALVRLVHVNAICSLTSCTSAPQGKMLQTLSQHSIQLLHMSLSWDYDPPSPSVDFVEDPADEYEMFLRPHVYVRRQQPLETLDIAALAGDATRAIPSLQYIFLTTSHVFQDASAWEVRRDVDGVGRLVQLSQADGKRVLKESLLQRRQ